MMQDDDLIERINDAYDPDELVYALGLSTEQLTYYLYDVILENRDKFVEIDDDEPDFD